MWITCHNTKKAQKEAKKHLKSRLKHMMYIAGFEESVTTSGVDCIYIEFKRR